jgi:hypothetical protein
MSEARDSLAFFEALFGDQPQGRILICEKTKGWSPHACVSPADAVHYVLGNVDVFHRVTLVEHKPKSGRGTEADTSALTDLWAEADVNGSPDGKGGVVSDAAASQRDAVDVLQSVLEPTFVVCSGYGVQSYWKLAEPLFLHTEAQRADAKTLVRGWHERLKRSAAERGIEKLDSVYDLARVLRPPGSFNGKGEHPVPVKLLMDGGPVYALAQLQAEAVLVPANARSEGNTARAVEQLLGEIAQLAKLARREGKSPGDGSDSDWDFYLCCEAIRYGCSDGELAALIRYNRTVHPDPKGKGLRDDYIERTVAAARKAVPHAGPAETDAEREKIGLALSGRWGLGEDDPIVGGRLVGPELDAIVRLRRRSGAELRLGHLRELFTPRAHTMLVSVAARTRFPMLNQREASDLAQRVIALCEFDEADERALADQWTSDFINGAGAITDAAQQDAKMHGEPVERWKALDKRESDEAALDGHDVASRTALIRDEQGRLWLPAGALRVSLSPGAPTWHELNAELADAGWTRVPVEQWTPKVKRGAEGSRRIRSVFYVEPAGKTQPPDDDEGDDGAAR